MMRLAMSSAAAGLLRSILARSGVDRDRILLTEFRSTDWQSLTFTGEQHKIALRIPAPDASQIVGRIADGLEDAEFTLSGHVVADITVSGEPQKFPDGSMALTIEALTVES